MSWDTGAGVGGDWDSGAGATIPYNDPSSNGPFGSGEANVAGGFGEGEGGENRGNNRGCYNCGQEG